MSVYRPRALTGRWGSETGESLETQGPASLKYTMENNKETLFSKKVEAKDQYPGWSSHHYTYAVAHLGPQLHTEMCITHACLSYGQPTLKKTLLILYCIFTYLFYVEEAHAMTHW